MRASFLLKQTLPQTHLTPLSSGRFTGCSIAAAYGASHVVAVDINDERVQFSTREGFATKGYTLPMGPRPKDSAESLAKARETADTIIKETAPNAEGFDLVLECTGVESCIQAAVHVSAVPCRAIEKHLCAMQD